MTTTRTAFLFQQFSFSFPRIRRILPSGGVPSGSTAFHINTLTAWLRSYAGDRKNCPENPVNGLLREKRNNKKWLPIFFSLLFWGS